MIIETTMVELSKQVTADIIYSSDITTNQLVYVSASSPLTQQISMKLGDRLQVGLLGQCPRDHLLPDIHPTYNHSH